MLNKQSIVLVSVIASFTIFADQTSSKQTDSTQTSSASNTNNTSQTQRERYESDLRRKQWNLDREEWARYESIMKGPRGLWSPNLDPLQVLGIDARTSTERSKYARLMLDMELKRHDKEWAFAKEYTKQGALLKKQRDASKTGTVPAYLISRKKVYVKLPCHSKCEGLVKNLLKKRQSFDVYVVDATNVQIATWAKKMLIPPLLVSKGQITLNHINVSGLKNKGVTKLPFVSGES